MSAVKLIFLKTLILKKYIYSFLAPKNNKNFILLSFFYGAITSVSYIYKTPSFFMHCFYILGINLILHHIYEANIPLKKMVFSMYMFFYGYFLVSLCWIQLSFISLNLWWVTPIAALIFPIILSVFYFWVGFILYHTQNYKKWMFTLSFALSFWGVELLMSHCLTGFPWILSAYTLNEYAMQGGGYFGVYGMSLIVILWSTAFFYVRCKYIILIVIGIVHGAGYYVLKTTLCSLTSTTVRLVHPGIKQQSKMSDDALRQNFDMYLALSALPFEKPLNLIIWPEAVLPIALNYFPHVIDEIKQIVPPLGYAIVGCPRMDEEKNIYTSAYTISKNNIVDYYDKNHLVPFGEYLPFSKYLKNIGLTSLAMGRHDYTNGKMQHLQKLKDIPPFVVLICYEIIFSNQILNTENKRPKWILNITNDAWYLESFGIYQHLNIVRWRAVEEGLPIIRCANCGVSAIIGPKGQIISSIAANKVGVLDDFIPEALPKTVYAKIRDWIFGNDKCRNFEK